VNTSRPSRVFLEVRRAIGTIGRPGGLVAAAALATIGLLVAGGPPAGAALLPAPLPTPTSLPVQLPAPTSVPAPAPVNQVPVPPVLGGSRPASGGAGSGQPAPAGGDPASGGGGAADPAAGQAAPAYAPSPAEQAALPPEPQRYVLEALQRGLLLAGRLQRPAADHLAFRLHRRAGGALQPDLRHPPLPHRHRPGRPHGHPIYAAATGVAHLYRTASGYGNYILVTHGNGWFTLYGHLSEFLVPDGQVVQRGQPIARSGSTGFSTGPHLHFEIRRGQKPMDPCAYLCR
jgi:Peptidase family M23